MALGTSPERLRCLVAAGLTNEDGLGRLHVTPLPRIQPLDPAAHATKNVVGNSTNPASHLICVDTITVLGSNDDHLVTRLYLNVRDINRDRVHADGTDDRSTPDTYTGRLAHISGGQVVNDLVGQRSAPRDNADRTFFVNFVGHYANLALPG